MKTGVTPSSVLPWSLSDFWLNPVPIKVVFVGTGLNHEIGQLEGALACCVKIAFLHHVSDFWLNPVPIKVSLLAPDSTRNRTTSKCPFWAAHENSVTLICLPWSLSDFWLNPVPIKVVFVGTGLNQKSDNLKVPIVSCCVKRRSSIMCPARVFAGTGLNQKSDNFKVPILSCYENRCYAIICLALVFVRFLVESGANKSGLCWHRTQPEIGQLEGAHCELLREEAFLHHVSGPCLCWHRTQPEIGQLQSAHSELLWKQVLRHHLSCLGLCWHWTQPVKIRIWDFRSRLPHPRASFHLHLQNWDFVRGSSGAPALRHYFRWHATMMPWSCEPLSGGRN